MNKAASSLGFDADRLTRVATWQDRYVAERKFAGSSVLLHRGGQEVYFNATGLRDVERDAPFTRDTLVRIYSMTKPVVSVALMILVERGLVPLGTPVSSVLPEFEDCQVLRPGATSVDDTEPCAAPTLRQLLNHTSGMTYPFNPGLVPQALADTGRRMSPDDDNLEIFVKDLARFPLAFVPGTKWEYSLGIDVIGRVIEVLSGQSLGAFLEAEIFGPLGMSETRFDLRDADAERFASLYTPLADDPFALNETNKSDDTLRLIDERDTTPYRNVRFESGGGGLIGTIDDYMIFCNMLRAGGVWGGQRILSPQTLRFMMRNHLPGDIASMGASSFAEQPMDGTGFGIGGSVVLDPGIVGTPGSVGDFSWGGMASTFFWVDPVLDLTCVFLTQLTPSSSYPARPELKALVHGALVG